MAEKFRLEDPGEGIHEAEILKIFVSSGQRVSEGDTLLEIETDKAAVEVPSPFEGEISSIEVEEGEQVRVGDVLITYQPSGEASKERESGEER